MAPGLNAKKISDLQELCADLLARFDLGDDGAKDLDPVAAGGFDPLPEVRGTIPYRHYEKRMRGATDF